MLNEIIQRRIGKCQVCGFYGVLLRKPYVSRGDLNAITGDTSDELPVLDLCLTCYETPAGCDSENKEHQRLPEQEYKR